MRQGKAQAKAVRPDAAASKAQAKAPAQPKTEGKAKAPAQPKTEGKAKASAQGKGKGKAEGEAKDARPKPLATPKNYETDKHTTPTQLTIREARNAAPRAHRPRKPLTTPKMTPGEVEDSSQRSSTRPRTVEAAHDAEDPQPVRLATQHRVPADHGSRSRRLK